MKSLRTLCFLSFVLAAALPATAADEMRKLDFLVGEWKGEAWFQMGQAKREYAIQHEKVTPRAGGLALQIEGQGRQKKEDGTAGDVVHDAFAMLRWDDTAKQYRFSTAVAGRGTGEASFEVTGPNRVVWKLDIPHGKTRYTISLTDQGEWFEIGEFSRDGEKWFQFFEMKLKKVK
jgi:hypothetical protein